MICYVFCFPIGDAYMAIHDPWGHGAILFHNFWPHYMGFDPCPSQQEWIKNSKNLKDSDSANQVSDLWSEFQDLQQFLFFLLKPLLPLRTAITFGTVTHCTEWNVSPAKIGFVRQMESLIGLLDVKGQVWLPTGVTSSCHKMGGLANQNSYVSCVLKRWTSDMDIIPSFVHDKPPQVGPKNKLITSNYSIQIYIERQNKPWCLKGEGADYEARRMDRISRQFISQGTFEILKSVDIWR
jgi:hypothetical protein